MIKRWFWLIVAAAVSMVSVSSQVGLLKLIEKSLPATRGALPGTGVTPSAWKIPAVTAWGVVLHIPPLGPVGSRSRMVAFHASLTPVFWTLSPNCPNCPGLIVAGPVLVSTRLGAEVSPISIETLALALCCGVFQVTT